MKKLPSVLFVALLLTGCGPNHEEQTAEKIRFAQESAAPELELHASGITDVTSLAKLINIEILGLGSNYITNVTPLAELTKLKTLWLPNNQITDVMPLAKLTKLRTLYLAGNPIPEEQIEMLRKALPKCQIEF
jgi:Leucine-rich repeat (LRR) protein